MPDAATTAVRPIAWGAKVSAEFRTKVISICAELGCNPDHLMAAMAFETGETFRPDIQNPRSQATGLIQFMPATARGLGTTIEALVQMTAETQLDFVAKYFKPMKGRMATLEDVYMAILFPVAVGKPNTHVLFAKGSREYDQNSGLDLDKDGNVTKAEAASLVRKRLERGLRPEFLG
jgi:hypothetical protein